MATASKTDDSAEASSPEYPERILGAPTRGRFFFGWYIVGAGSVIQFLVGALMNQAFGGYAAALTDHFGWSRGAISGAFSLSRVESGILGPLQGWMIDKFGPRAVMRFGLSMFAIGFILFSQTQNLLTFYAFFALMAVGAKLAIGCTSGQALSGGAMLALGSWAFMFSVFAGGFAFAWLVRKQWR